MYPNGYLCHDSIEASCRIKEFNSHSWDWITENCSSKMTETVTTAWTRVLAKVKLSLMRKIFLINYELLYSSNSISFLIYSLKRWLRFWQLCVFFLIILVFSFANHKKACLDQSVASLKGPRQHVVPWETSAYSQEKLKLLTQALTTVGTEAIKESRVLFPAIRYPLNTVCIGQQ